MMSDHAAFASLQVPTEWGTPKFQLGQTVSCDDGTGFIVGAMYSDEHSMNPEDDQECVGWWFWICVPTVVGERLVKNVWGKHQDVIQPAVETVGTVVPERQCRVTSAVCLEPLLYGVS